MPFVPEDTQKQRPATVSRTATLFVFPVRIRASRLIEAFRCGCGLIALLCDVVKLQYRLNKVNVTAIPLQTWTVPEVSSSLRHPDLKTVAT
jgi:hypothetical protein